MNIKRGKVLALSVITAIALQGSLFAKDEDKNKESLGSVDVVSTNASEDTHSYTVDTANTATRLNMSLKETPQSVSVVTSQQIEDLGLEDLNDIVDNVTGLYNSGVETERSSFSSRGFSINNYLIDGVSTTWNSQISLGESVQDLTMYDRVEVVRGANGLVTGAGNPSASINLIRKHANSKELTGNIKAQVGSWEKYRLDMDVTTPLTEDGSVRARIAASHEDSKSFLDYYHKKKDVLYTVVDADLSDRTQLSVGFGYQRNRPKGSTWGTIPMIDNNGNVLDFSRSTSTATKNTYIKSENRTYFANIEHYFKNDIKAYASVSRTNNTGSSDLMYMSGHLDPATGAGFTFSPGAYDNYRKQNNLDAYVSVPFTVGKLDQEILVGANYSKQKEYSTGGWYAGSVSNFYNWDGNYTTDYSTLDGTWSDASEIEQKGIYLVGRFSLTEQLKLILGSRFSSYEDKSTLTGTSFKEDNVVTPYAGIVYNITDDISTYASYTTIFQPQNSRDISGSKLDPVEGDAYEAGIKGEFFDDRLDASLSVFRIEQDNVAELIGNNSPLTGQSYYEAKEGTTSKGFEFQVNGEITPDWSITLGYAQFQAKDADKEKINLNLPRKTLRVFTKYKINRLSLGAGINYRSEIKSDQLREGGLTLVNLMAKYDISKNLSAQVNIDNLFDKKYFNNISSDTASYGTPRSALLTVKYSF